MPPVATTAARGLPTRPLSNVEKVATVLMTMGQQAAGEVMKHLEPPELRTVTHAMAELRPWPWSRSPWRSSHRPWPWS